jgi:hypothetical protein
MIVVKRGKKWAVVDRYGNTVSRHRTRSAAVNASGEGTYYVRRRRRYYAPVVRERVVVVERRRRKRRKNPWAQEVND